MNSVCCIKSVCAWYTILEVISKCRDEELEHKESGLQNNAEEVC